MARKERKQANSAGQPTISIQAERTAQSLADERARFMRRRMFMIGVPAVLVALFAGGFLYARGGNTGSTTQPALAVASTSVGAVAPPATVPVPSPISTDAQPTTPAPAIAPAVAQPTSNAPAIVGLTCPEITGLPIYTNAVCVKHESDQDEGVTKFDNTYTSADPADTVRRFYESAFAQNGWTIAESKQDLEDSSWEYTVMQAQRRIKVKVDAQSPGEGVGTKLSITEK
jgi:hypothetical protein